MRTVSRRLRIALVGALVLGVVAAAVLVSTGRFELGRHGSSAWT